jgi:glycosyltransferase involved in cell wall biosynthesis
VDRFIAVSDYCAEFMRGYLGIPLERMAVVPLGVNTDGCEARTTPPETFTVGYFARVAPEKGLHVLADAYVRFRRRIGDAPARLEAAGYLSASRRDRHYFDGVTHALERAGLAGEFTYRGEVDRQGKLGFLRTLDVLSVPATYDEPKGMFLLEGMACGVPVVQPRRGAFTEVVERTGGGLLVEPDDPERLADGLYALWNDRELTARLGRQAFAGVRKHYAIAQSAKRLAEVYQELVTLEK